MSITFYPNEDDLSGSSITEKLDLFIQSAESYKAAVLDTTESKLSENANGNGNKRSTPRDIKAAFNWGEIAKLLREIRDLPEATRANKLIKADYLTKLAEVYEILRGAKMTKLEAVRLALMNEAGQLRSSASQAV